VPEAVVCTICRREVPDDEDYSSEVVGWSQEDDEFLLLLMCERCQETHVVTYGGDA
jgi:hypothetical protein